MIKLEKNGKREGLIIVFYRVQSKDQEFDVDKKYEGQEYEIYKFKISKLVF